MKVLVTAILAVVALFAGFFFLNSYIYNEKQAEEQSLADGEHFGFVRALVDNDTALDFDSAVWLTGEEGVEAAIRAGACTSETREECLPNDYFIENAREETQRIEVSPQVEVIMQTWEMEENGISEQRIDVAEFAEAINTQDLHWSSLPYTLTVQNNTVVRIEEVYIP